MRRLIVATALIVLMPAVVACEDDVSNVAPTPTPFSERVPASVADLPEGTLVVQDDNPIGYPRLFAVGPDGSEQIGKGPSISVSPDHRGLAAIEWDADHYRWRIRLLGPHGEERAVLQAPESKPFANAPPPFLTWSPDGEWLAYTVADEPAAERQRLFVVRADGTGKREVWDVGDYPGYYAYPIGWTGDRQLLLRTSGGLLLTGEEKSIPFPESNEMLDAQISPDGSKVAVQMGYFEDEGNVSVTHYTGLWVLEHDTTEWRRVANLDAEVMRPEEWPYVSAVPPAVTLTARAALLLKGPPPMVWSPDGTRIAYERTYTDKDGRFRSNLRVVDVRSGEAISVTEESGWQAAWSSDGRYLVAPTETALVLYDTQGGTRTIDMSYAKQATWSRSGTLVAIAAGGISLIDPETRAGRSVVRDDGQPVYGGLAAYGSWVWSPSGRYLAFSTTSDQYTKGSVQILDSMNATVTTVLDQQSFVPVGWLAGD